MVLRGPEDLTIDNLRGHSAESVERLRQLLAAGAVARPDPRHRGFYEVEDGGQVFYINFHPLKSKVLFLATWNLE